MKKQLLMFCCLALLLVTGCSKDNSADVKEIFKTIPSNASCVAVADIQSIVEKTGSKIKDGKIEFSPEMKKALQSKGIPGTDAMLNGDSGIDPTVAVVYMDGATTYLTGMISSTDKFREYVENETGQKFTESNGINTCGKYAYADNRFWSVVNGRNYIDADMIKEALNLSEAQSFASKKDFASKLADSDEDIRGWADIDALMNLSSGSFEQRAISKMVLQTLFSDAAFAYFDIEFEKGEADLSATILNDKGTPAKYNLPTQKIDPSTIRKIGGKADMIYAVAISKKMIEQLTQSTKGAPSVLGVYLQTMKCLDGTTAFAASKNGGVNGVIATDGNGLGDLTTLLRGFGVTTRQEGKDILFSMGNPQEGSRDVAQLADKLKGSMMGAVIVDDSMPQIDMVIVELESEKGGLKLEVKAVAKDRSVNFLQSVIK